MKRYLVAVKICCLSTYLAYFSNANEIPEPLFQKKSPVQKKTEDQRFQEILRIRHGKDTRLLLKIIEEIFLDGVFPNALTRQILIEVTENFIAKQGQKDIGLFKDLKKWQQYQLIDNTLLDYRKLDKTTRELFVDLSNVDYYLSQYSYNLSNIIVHQTLLDYKKGKKHKKKPSTPTLPSTSPAVNDTTFDPSIPVEENPPRHILI